MFWSNALLLIFVFQIVKGDCSCTEKMDFGKACSQNQSSIRVPSLPSEATNKCIFQWYYDTKLAYCYPYEFLGCQESSNSFPNQDECLSACKPADQFSCGGNTDAQGVCFTMTDESCTKQGKICVMGGTVGFCCDKQVQEQWNKELSPVCGSGNLVQMEMWFGKTPMIGRDCAHKFCPKNSKCVQGKYTAHCCQ